jgi:hypothetical protein
MNEQQNTGKPNGRERGGFEFGSGKDRDRRDSRKPRDSGGGSASFRIVTELSTLEKALTKADLGAQKAALDSVLKTIRPLRLTSIDGLDANSKGRLLTSLLRVMRQPKPKVVEAPAAEAAPAEASPVEAAPTDAAPLAEGESAAAPVVAPPMASAPAPAAVLLNDVQFVVGLIWKSVNEQTRAEAAFEASGRQPTEADLIVPSEPVRQVHERSAVGKGPRNKRTDVRQARTERPPRKFEKPEPFASTGDLAKDAEQLEKMGRTRDAGRLYEKQNMYAEALRAYEAGGDLKAALRNAALGKLEAPAQALIAKLPKTEVVRTLEKLNAWELLMAFHVKNEAYESVAQLYERANQFDQAGLAYERAQKLSLARRAYERAKDFAAANRVRDAEVTRLVEKGDRLGAATLLMAVGRRAETLDLMKALPAPKAYGFLKKLKLEDDARALAEANLQEAIASNNELQRGRWLEVTGRMSEALELYLSTGRKDKASFVLESLGQPARAAQLAEEAGQLVRAEKLFRKANDTVNADRVAQLPRPEVKPGVAGEVTASEATSNDDAPADSGSPSSVEVHS